MSATATAIADEIFRNTRLQTGRQAVVTAGNSSHFFRLSWESGRSVPGANGTRQKVRPSHLRNLVERTQFIVWGCKLIHRYSACIPMLCQEESCRKWRLSENYSRLRLNVQLFSPSWQRFFAPGPTPPGLRLPKFFAFAKILAGISHCS